MVEHSDNLAYALVVSGAAVDEPGKNGLSSIQVCRDVLHVKTCIFGDLWQLVALADVVKVSVVLRIPCEYAADAV